MNNKMVVAGTNAVSAQQLSEVFRQIGTGEIDGQVIQAVIEHRNPWGEEKRAVTIYLTNTSKQVVDYDRSIADSLKAGKYDWVNDDITDANFPPKEAGKREVEFGRFHFSEMIGSGDAIIKMKLVGFRPATMKELLAYGDKNPEVQCKFPIIALGSVVNPWGQLRVGCLNRAPVGRCADLGYVNQDHTTRCRFLGVRV